MVLVILNIATLVTVFIIMNKGPHHRRGSEKNDPAKFLVTELNLDEEQQKEFEKLRIEHHEQMKQMHDSMKVVHDNMPQLIVDGNDSVALHELEKMGTYQTKIEMYTYEHFKKVYALCNNQQKQKFTGVIEQMLKMLAPPPPGKKDHDHKLQNHQ